MTIRCTSSRNFELKDDDRTIGTLIYSGPLSMNALLSADGKVYELTTAGIFDTGISIRYQGAEIGHMKMDWKGHMVIKFLMGDEYRLKFTGSWVTKYELQDRTGAALMQLKAEFNWRKLVNDYSVKLYAAPNTTLVLLAAFAANYYSAVVASV
jgi:hypothetical protein